MMKKINKLVRVYNGADFCQNCKACPVVEYNKNTGEVTISDPAKPNRGKFSMSVEEYDALIKNAKLIN